MFLGISYLAQLFAKAKKADLQTSINILETFYCSLWISHEVRISPHLQK